MTGPGSGGNVLAALCSFLVPGLGQLLQGRAVMALIFLLLSAVMWIFLLGWLIHILAALDAARFHPKVDAGDDARGF